MKTPMTREFLERNGFEPVPGGMLRLKIGEDRFHIMRDGTCIVNFAQLPRPLRYVEELQSLLTLCGYEDKAKSLTR